MSKVTLETSTIASAIKKANAIAPTKGKDFDQVAGFMCFTHPNSGELEIRATNRDVFYREKVEAVKVEGEEDSWRVPSLPMNSFIGSLPIGSGKMVTIEHEGSRLYLSSGRAKATIPLIPTGDYPEWEGFDPSGLYTVQNFGSKLEQVAWATSKDNLPPMNGVYIDGDNLVATNRYRVALAPVEVNLGESDPVVVPMALLTPIINQIIDVRVGVQGKFLCISPDKYTEIKCILYQESFPNVNPLLERDHEATVVLDKDMVADSIRRALSIGSSDRQSALRVSVGNREVAFFVEDSSGSGNAEDAVYLVGQADHDPVEYWFAPDNFANAISNSPDKDVMFHYNMNNSMLPVKIESSSGYTAIVAPRKGRQSEG